MLALNSTPPHPIHRKLWSSTCCFFLFERTVWSTTLCTLRVRMVPAQAFRQMKQTLSITFRGSKDGGKSVDTILMVTKDFWKKRRIFFKKNTYALLDSIFFLGGGRCANRCRQDCAFPLSLGCWRVQVVFFWIDLRWRFQWLRWRFQWKLRPIGSCGCLLLRHKSTVLVDSSRYYESMMQEPKHDLKSFVWCHRYSAQHVQLPRSPAYPNIQSF